MAASVSTNDLKPANVTSDKIAADAITATHIAAGAVGATELADDSVLTAKILDANVTMAKLAGTPAGELGGTWSSPTVNATHSGSAHPIANSASYAAASAPVTMTTALTVYDATSATLTLAAGTWLLIGHAEVTMAVGTGAVLAYIRSGASTIEAQTNILTVAVGMDTCAIIPFVVTPGSSTTYKISATANQNGCTLQGGSLTAVRIA